MMAIVVLIDFIVILRAHVEGVGDRGEYRREDFGTPDQVQTTEGRQELPGGAWEPLGSLWPLGGHREQVSKPSGRLWRQGP